MTQGRGGLLSLPRMALPSTTLLLAHWRFPGLNHTACTLAVYASSPWSPMATQDSLPAAGQALPGGAGYPLGSYARFQSSSISSSLPRLCLAHDNRSTGYPPE